MTQKPPQSRSTTPYFVQSALSFAIALIGLCVAIAYLPGNAWIRAFLALGVVFLATSCFGLAKCVRDAQERNSVLSRLDEARLERLLAEFDPYRVPAPLLPPPGMPPVGPRGPVGPPM